MGRLLAATEALIYIVFVCGCFVVIATSISRPFDFDPLLGLALIPLLFLARAVHVARGASDDFG